MPSKKIIISTLVFCLCFSFAFPLLAEEKEDSERTLYGNFLFGYRMVDTSGSPFKYKEDINLDEGARLFNFSLHYTPKESVKKYLDRLDVSIYNYAC